MIAPALRRFLAALVGPSSPSRRRFTRLTLEALEDRAVPATLQVGPSEPFTTIQSAVMAANPGDIVQVDPGTYQEQVTISKSIELVGPSSCNGTATILAPTGLGASTAANPDAIVRITGAGTSAEVENFTIEGAAGGTANLLYGVRVDGNANAAMNNNTITNIIDSSDPRFGVAIDVGNSTLSPDGTGAQVGTASIQNNTISNYQRAGIVINNTGSSAHILYNTITASATFQSDSQTGVEVSDAAVADVENNSISGNKLPTTAVEDGTGVLLFSPGLGTEVETNCISGNDYGVFGIQVTSSSTSEGQGVSVESNTISQNTFVGIEFDNSTSVDISYNNLSANGSHNTADGGIYLFQSTNNLLVSNSSKNNNGSGIYIDANSTGNLLHSNVCTGNDFSNNSTEVNADAVDLSTGTRTADTANTWTNNIGNTSITQSGDSLLKKKPHRFDDGGNH